VSLILEALKKLEREKGTPERGFLVLAHLQRPLQGKGRGWLLIAAGLGLAAVVGLGLVVWRWQGDRSRAADGPAGNGVAQPAAAPAAAVPAPARPGWTTPLSPQSAVGPARTAAPSPRAAVAPARHAAPSPAPADPTERTSSLEADRAAPDLRLNAISHQDGRPVAILNDRLVREGDAFDGIRVLRIGEAEIEVEVGGVRRVIGF
jgi:hypothetical protein